MEARADLSPDDEAAFMRDLTALIPHLRAFARSLTGHMAEADDLAQETVLKAWKSRRSYEPGTNLKAWTFMILRNQFYSDKRRAWRSSQLDPEVAERTLVATDDPSAAMELNDMRQALNKLPAAQREALILVGAGGMSYEEAAVVCGCRVGTVKSRVSRGRDALQALLSDGDLQRDDQPAAQAMSSILGDVDRLRAGAAAS